MSESTSETGALSFEQAVASLTPAEPVDEAPAAPVEAAAEPEEPQGEDQTPEEAEAEPAEPAEGDETEAEPEPVVAAEPPKYWSQDAKAKFAELPPELQAVVLAQEGPREEAAAKAKAEAAAKVQAADTELGKVAQLAEALADRLPQWVANFEARWGANPDWAAYAQEYGVEAAYAAEKQHDLERQQLVEAAQAKTVAESQAFQAFVQSEMAKLAEVDPDLAHPETGAAKRTEVSSYLVAQGIPADALRQISAVEMAIAHKAKRWDDAQAALKARPKTPTAPVQRAAVRPSATPAQTSTQRTAISVQNRFNAKPDIDNAVAMLLTRKQ